MDKVPARTDGVAFIRVKKPYLAQYLTDVRKLDDFVPLNPVTPDTDYVTMVDRATKEPQYLIEIDYNDEED